MADQGKKNRLVNETSPYLLQHAHNPVDWYPWGEEALAAAKEQDKPILLSIGYSACHWCHVMERESFENEEIAALMNKYFICIKVDREERPDLDQIYMNAVQMMTGSGGWPMTVFLTPDGIPFYGGTYFPPVDRYNMPGFPRVLIGVSEAYRNRRADIESTGQEILKELQSLNNFRVTDEELSDAILRKAYHALAQRYDHRYGGFGRAPKFPQPMNLNFILQTYYRSRNEEALEILENTLDCMARGGIYDHLAGGFARYSTDEKWLVPHFEKMLYDNALLSSIYLQAYRLTGREQFRRVSVETLDWVMREMTDPSGGFYSTLDADSEGVEGKYYVWEKLEIERLLGADAASFSSYYGVTDEGNFEDRNILHIPKPEQEWLQQCAKHHSITVDELILLLDRSRQKLLKARAGRVRPGCDDKILTGWNALMIKAFAEAGRVLEHNAFTDAAVKAAQFVFNSCLKDEKLMHSYKNGEARFNGYLDDYAYLLEALIAVYEATFDEVWIEKAIWLADSMIELFWDSQDGGFFFTSCDHEDLITRTKDYSDNAVPSGNSVAATALLRLHLLTGNEEYQNKAVNVLRLVSKAMERFPGGFGQMLCALDLYLHPPVEVVVVGRRQSEDTKELLRAVYTWCKPNTIVVYGSPDESSKLKLPLLEGREMLDGKATAYVCERSVCKQPVTTVEELRKQLSI